MELVKSNAQGELTALERGLHALHSGKDVRSYAAGAGRVDRTVYNEVLAARVADAVADIGDDPSRLFSRLVEVHAAPSWLWPALVQKLVTDDMTVEAARRLVANLKDLPKPAEWLDAPAIAAAIVEGTTRKTFRSPLTRIPPRP